MKITSIKRASGQVVELESEEALTIDEMKEALGETDQNQVLEQLIKLVEELVKQGGAKPPVINVAPAEVNVAAPAITVTPAPVHVAAPQIKVEPAPVTVTPAPAASQTNGKDLPAYSIEVTARDGDKRMKSLVIRPAKYLGSA